MGPMGQPSVNHQPRLHDYGIQTEDSDIRCHVAPGTRSIFVFRTATVLSLLNGRHTEALAGQAGVSYPTGKGYLVSWRQVPDIRRIQWNSFPWWDRFKRDQTTSEKGAHAVWVCTELMRLGRFPLWVEAKESERAQVQLKGTDIVLWGRWKIQVKCDFYAGDGVSGTGNLFIQTAELNPLRMK
jgi:hypothetical protein